MSYYRRTRVVVPSTSRQVAEPPKPKEFSDLQKTMESELAQKANEWESEVEKMHHEFFNVKVSKPSGQEAEVGASDQSQKMLHFGNRDAYIDLPDGTQVFRQKFDLRDYDPEDLNVKIENDVIRVSAQHKRETGAKKSIMKQFEREVDVPEDVNPDDLVSYLSPEGILTVEAPVDPTRVTKAKLMIMKSKDASRNTPPSLTAPPSYKDIKQEAEAEEDANPASLLLTPEASNYNFPVFKDTEYGQLLQMSILMGQGYKPEDIFVTLLDKRVSVKAQQEEIVGGRTSKKEFTRSFDTKARLVGSTFRAVLTPNGSLVIGGAVWGTDNPQMMKQMVFDAMPVMGKPCKIKV